MQNQLTAEEIMGLLGLIDRVDILIAFKREMLELIRDIARNVVIENYENGKLQTENESMLMPENTNENIKKNIEERKNFKSIIYQAKSSQSERTCGGTITNQHPTIKPIALMEYLIKMVTPKGGIVLDPFAGSGSTLVAAKQNGFQYIGIEMTEEYIQIIEARLK
jgi:DNA modification methylase